LTVRRLIKTEDIEAGEITKEKLATNIISFIVPLQLIKDQTGLTADSTGVKYTSGKFKIDTNGLKSIVIRATWTATATDSVTMVELYDETGAAVKGSISGEIVYVEGNVGTDQEAEAKTGWADGEYLQIELEVTTASATPGATTDLTYVIVELEFGVS